MEQRPGCLQDHLFRRSSDPRPPGSPRRGWTMNESRSGVAGSLRRDRAQSALACLALALILPLGTPASQARADTPCSPTDVHCIQGTISDTVGAAENAGGDATRTAGNDASGTAHHAVHEVVSVVTGGTGGREHQGGDRPTPPPSVPPPTTGRRSSGANATGTHASANP